MKYSEAIEKLRESNKNIILTGAQRSGTRIATRMIAQDLGILYVDERAYKIFNDRKFASLFANKKERFVVQSPAMSHICHTIEDAIIVFMTRDIYDILKSQERLGWKPETELGQQTPCLDRFPELVKPWQPACVMKRIVWEAAQKPLDDERYSVEYESLSEHPLWVDKEERTDFRIAQTGKKTRRRK
jgi:hypothetical protein